MNAAVFCEEGVCRWRISTIPQRWNLGTRVDARFTRATAARRANKCRGGDVSRPPKHLEQRDQYVLPQQEENIGKEPRKPDLSTRRPHTDPCSFWQLKLTVH